MLSQNHLWRLSALAVVICLLTACASTPQTASNTHPTANLSNHKTYEFVPRPGPNRGGNTTLLTTYFETSVSKQMDARGYRKVDTNPDLLVNSNANVKEQADVESMPGPAAGCYGYRGGLCGGSQAEAVHYKVGTAHSDVVDASSAKWCGKGGPRAS